jgi:hypothetical protein
MLLYAPPASVNAHAVPLNAAADLPKKCQIALDLGDVITYS